MILNDILNKLFTYVQIEINKKERNPASRKRFITNLAVVIINYMRNNYGLN